MKLNYLLYGIGIVCLFSCSKKGSNSQPQPQLEPQPIEKIYTITETFEGPTKIAYAAAEVKFTTGTWLLDDALLGDLTTDVKNGTKSVRLRSGKLAIKYDIQGVKTVYVKHAKFGSDADSQWELWMSADGGVAYTKVGETINTTSTALATDSFKVTTTAKVRFEIRKAGTTRINIDDVTFKGIGESGVVIGEPDTSPVDVVDPTDPTAPLLSRGFPDGSGPDVPPASGENSNLLLGNPSNAEMNILLKDNYLLDMKYYAQSYSSTRGTPNWVSWHLDASNIVKATDRLDNFAAFSDLPTGWYQVQSNSYSGSGFDRGHNCPSADRVSSVEANAATFLMTNMIPQAPNNNQKTWANFENYLRQLVVAGNEVYIIMGSYGSGGTGTYGTVTTINNGNVTVPGNIWKVAVILPAGDNDLSRISTTTRVIAINTPNINSIDQDWKKYITTVRDIETATGYDLLSNLPLSIQNVLETQIDAGN